MEESCTYSGGCLCGAFQFEVEGPLTNVRLCHCDLCRKANGTAFSANCKVPRKRFRVTKDEGSLRRYESSAGAWRVFCGTCGSPAYADVAADKEHIRIRLGTLEREAQAEIAAHVWIGSKAEWDAITFELPRYEKGT